MVGFKITKSTPSHLIICGGEYADKAGIEPLERLKVGEDGVYSLSRKPTPTAKLMREFGWATTDIAEIALCEYTQELYDLLWAEKDNAPFLYFCDFRIEDWEKQKQNEIGVDYDDED